jgi:hypothetical protein
MGRQPVAAALVVAALMLSASAQSQNMGLQVDSSGRVGIGTATPAEMLDVRGNLALSGSLLGASSVGGKAAVIQGFGSGGSNAEFSFKYDFANFGNTPSAIQVWNAATGVFKTFVIDHPTDPNRYLVHATLEGPEGAVFYRGSARLVNGRAEVALPAYFEDLADAADRTIILTNIDGFDRIAVAKQGGDKIVDGRFVVVSDNLLSTQEFDWEVKAVRRDGPRLAVTPHKTDIKVVGFGPYRFVNAP